MFDPRMLHLVAMCGVIFGACHPPRLQWPSNQR